MRFLLLGIALTLLHFSALSQCNVCTPDLECVSEDAFPTICPFVLPDATAGEEYEEVITFFLPAEIVDPESELGATLLEVTVANVSGLPFGMEFTLNSDDNTYFPADGEETGCATVCGTPLIAGDYLMTIDVSVVVSVFGFEQTLPQSFQLPLTVLEGAAGNSLFTLDEFVACDSLFTTPELVFMADGGVVSYEWDFGNGMFFDSTSPGVVVYSDPGDYNISLNVVVQDFVLTGADIITLGGGWGGDLDDGFGLLSPDPYFVISDAGGSVVYTSPSVTDTETPTFNNLSVLLEGGPLTIAFYDEDGTITDNDFLGSTTFELEDGTVVVNANGTTCSLNIELQTSFDLTESETVSVFPSPNVAIQLSDDENYLFTDIDDALEYQWFLDGDSLDVNNDSLLILDPGIYTLHLTNLVGCDGSSQEFLVCPDVNLTYDSSNDVLLAPEGFLEYIWYYNGLELDGADDFQLSSPEDGNYSVEIIDENGCEVESSVFSVTYIAEANSQPWKVFPNPTADFLQVDGDVTDIDSYRIVDLSGKIWGESSWNSSESRIDVRSLPSGLYTLQILSLKQKPSVLRFVVGAR